MSERMAKSYKRLFEVRVLHHYWLDEGAVVFDLIPQTKKNQRLQTYDMRAFLAVRPTVATEKLMASFGCLFRETALGFIVAAHDAAVLPADTVFDFMVTVKDSRFYDYTALTLRPQEIYELHNESDKTTYRYKENVPLLSNLTGTTRAGALFLSKEPPSLATDDQVESLFLFGGMLVQLTGDGPNAAMQKLDDHADKLPAYVNQGDVPVTAPPPGLSGAPTRGIRLTDGMADDVFALLSLRAANENNASFSFVDAGHPKTTPPVYQVRFKNRATFWRYLDKRNRKPLYPPEDESLLPMTFFGHMGDKQKPSEGLVKVEKSSTGVKKLVSEIYV